MSTIFQQEIKTASKMLVDRRLLDRKTIWWQTGLAGIVHADEDCVDRGQNDNRANERKNISPRNVADMKHCSLCVHVSNIETDFSLPLQLVASILEGEEAIKKGKAALRTKNLRTLSETFGTAYRAAYLCLTETSWHDTINLIEPEAVLSVQKRLLETIDAVAKGAGQHRDYVTRRMFARLCVATVTPRDTGGDRRDVTSAYEAWCLSRAEGIKDARAAAIRILLARRLQEKHTPSWCHKFLSKLIPQWEVDYQKIVGRNKTLLVGMTLTVAKVGSNDLCGTLLSFPHVNARTGGDFIGMSLEKTVMLLPESLSRSLEAATEWREPTFESVVVQDDFDPEMLPLILSLWEPADSASTYHQLRDTLCAVKVL